MNLPLRLAWRIFRHDGDVKSISRPAVRIATCGVALGVAVMIVSVAVVVGFKREVRQKVVGMNSHIQVRTSKLSDDLDIAPICVTDSICRGFAALPDVRHVQRFSNKPGMLKTEDGFEGIVLRGYGPDFDSSFLASHLVEGNFEAFSDSVPSNRIYISQSLANRLKLKVGSPVYAYFFDKSVRTRRPRVAGLYATNFKEFDNTVVFTDLCTVNRLCAYAPDECTGLELAASDFDRLDAATIQVSAYASRLRNSDSRLDYSVSNVRQIFAPLFSWLTMLDTNIWVILALMTAVSVFTMISGLLIIILEQTQFIGTMKAMGSTNGMLRRLFLYLSAFIVGKGVLIGNVLALALILLQQHTGFVTLDAENYYVDVVPVDLNGFYVLCINLSTLLVSVAVLVIPSYLISNIHPARSIRFE